jgi:hypothetical protein
MVLLNNSCVRRHGVKNCDKFRNCASCVDRTAEHAGGCRDCRAGWRYENGWCHNGKFKYHASDGLSHVFVNRYLVINNTEANEACRNQAAAGFQDDSLLHPQSDRLADASNLFIESSDEKRRCTHKLHRCQLQNNIMGQ